MLIYYRKADEVAVGILPSLRELSRPDVVSLVGSASNVQSVFANEWAAVVMATIPLNTNINIRTLRGTPTVKVGTVPERMTVCLSMLPGSKVMIGVETFELLKPRKKIK